MRSLDSGNRAEEDRSCRAAEVEVIHKGVRGARLTHVVTVWYEVNGCEKVTTLCAGEMVKNVTVISMATTGAVPLECLGASLLRSGSYERIGDSWNLTSLTLNLLWIACSWLPRSRSLSPNST